MKLLIIIFFITNIATAQTLYIYKSKGKIVAYSKQEAKKAISTYETK